MNMPLVILTDTPDPADVLSVRAQLSQFNLAATRIDDQRALAVLVKDPETGDVLGGLTGRTSRGMLFVEVFFVAESLRGTGLGSRVLRMAEEEAVRRGCRHGLLHTNTFQAPEFYKKNGWVEMGSIPSDPPGNYRIFFSKQLDA
ncbi:GNAT family N-acetyltransferase [Dyella sp. 2HG41-7]|uniref:GNAT family N-acetyltransferase n=1 Tax=Dyella sp. 2HG41-7 TaxID=2883239 RepID=UPI001F22BB67|nr:GNAT family N-acetyltransferase [Dyella sp. 2HG41-7]